MRIEPELHQDLLPGTFGDSLIGWLRRGLGCLLLAVTGLGWLSLLSWSAPDVAGPAGASEHLLGAGGGQFADFTLQFLGLAGTVLLAGPTFVGIDLLAAYPLGKAGRRALAWLLATVLLAGACSTLPAPSTWPFESGLGGLAGDGVREACLAVLSHLAGGLAGMAAGGMLAALGALSLLVSLGVSPSARPALKIQRVPGDLPDLAQPPADEPASRTDFEAGSGAGRREPEPKLETAVEEAGAWSPPPVETPGPAPETVVRVRLMPGERGRAPAFAQVAEPPRAASPLEAAPPMEEPDHPSEEASGDEPRPIHVPYGDDAYDDEGSQRIAQRFAPGRARAAPVAGSVGEEPVEASTKRQAAWRQVLDLFERKWSEEDEATGGEAAPAAATARTPARAEAPEEPHAPDTGAPLSSPLAPSAAVQRPLAEYRPPALRHLRRTPGGEQAPPQGLLRAKARMLEAALSQFQVKGRVVGMQAGPLATLFELEPAPGTKPSRVASLAEDIAGVIGSLGVRIGPMPGRNTLGIEVPNGEHRPIGLREVLESEAFRQQSVTLPLAIGRSVAGQPLVADLVRMPNLLIAGSPDGGRAQLLNAVLLSLLFRLSPDQCRLLLIDPGLIDLTPYAGIPHLLGPVITEPARAVAALAWCSAEMDRRYQRIAHLKARSIEAYNNMLHNARRQGTSMRRVVQTGFDRQGKPVFIDEVLEAEPMPHVVVVVAELADLMRTAGKEVEAAAQQLALRGRAAGIHLIAATDRPSIDVATPALKSAFAARLGLRMASRIDSRSLLGEQGAEMLLGGGDMLFNPGGGVIRAHAPEVAGTEVDAVVAELRLYGAGEAPAGLARPAPARPSSREAAERQLYDRAIDLAVEERSVTPGRLVAAMGIASEQAEALLERMERDGILGGADAGGGRAVLVGRRASA